MLGRDFFIRINQIDKLIYDWMDKRNVVKTTPAEIIEFLISKEVYASNNRNGKLFRDDLRVLRDNEILHLFKYIDVKQEYEGSTWHIYKKNNSAYDAFDLILNFSSGEKLTRDIERLESNLRNMTQLQVAKFVQANDIGHSALHSALMIKNIAGQINVIVHTLGILNSIPFILEAGEVIESVSLGANNAGSKFDLVTDRRIAEFKFINWKGKDTIRQNNTFIDFFNLVECNTIKKKCLYILDRKIVIKFFSNNRAISSVLSKNRTASDSFFNKYGKRYKTVLEYYTDKRLCVDIIDLNEVCPEIFS